MQLEGSVCMSLCECYVLIPLGYTCVCEVWCVCLCVTAVGQCQVWGFLCVFLCLCKCLCVCVLVWSAAMLLGSRWHHGWQGRGCLAQLIRQLRIGQLGGPSASRVCMCVYVCTTECHDVDSGGPVGPVTRPCRVLLSSLSECPLCHPASSPLSLLHFCCLSRSVCWDLLFYLSYSFFLTLNLFLSFSHTVLLVSVWFFLINCQ